MPRVRFKQFIFDTASKELWEEDKIIPMQPKQAEVLALLIENHESLISRDTIKSAVWGSTVVEFDQSINFCIKGIRQILGDDPKAPTFIQTVPRRGYKFIASVENLVIKKLDTSKRSSSIHSLVQSKQSKLASSLRYILASSAGLIFTVSAALWWANVVQPAGEADNAGLFVKYEQNLKVDFQRAIYLFKRLCSY